MGIAEAELEQIREMIEGELAEEPSALERLRRVLEAFVLDSMCYISLSRKISYLNSCEDSGMFATRLEMVRILRGLVCQAQDAGELRRVMDADDITELVMGLYLITQFQWVHLERHPVSYWTERAGPGLPPRPGLRPAGAEWVNTMDRQAANRAACRKCPRASQTARLGYHRTEVTDMWIFFAAGSALFAGATAILAKCGIRKNRLHGGYRHPHHRGPGLRLDHGSGGRLSGPAGKPGRDHSALSDPVGSGHRGFLAVLLPGPPDRDINKVVPH